MNIPEFSDEFDVLLNSYSTIEMKGLTQDLTNIKLDEYEKSVYLTLAQDELVRKILSPNFEGSEELRRALNKSFQTYKTSLPIDSTDGISTDSIFFSIPDNTMKIGVEKLYISQDNNDCIQGKEINVIPITHDEYLLQKDNPFRRPKAEGRTIQAWRLDYGDIEDKKVVEIIPPKNVIINEYFMRFLPKLEPIILTDLNYLTIDGISTQNECKLDSLLHRDILNIAVQEAIRVIIGTNSTSQAE